MMPLILANEVPSPNVIDWRGVQDFIILSASDYQAALFYSAMTGALTVLGCVFVALAFCILVRECKANRADFSHLETM